MVATEASIILRIRRQNPLRIISHQIILGILSFLPDPIDLSLIGGWLLWLGHVGVSWEHMECAKRCKHWLSVLTGSYYAEEIQHKNCWPISCKEIEMLISLVCNKSRINWLSFGLVSPSFLSILVAKKMFSKYIKSFFFFFKAICLQENPNTKIKVKIYSLFSHLHSSLHLMYLFK